MLLFMDGFDHYVTADFNKKWSSVNSSSVIVSSSGRRGSAAASLPFNSGGLQKNIAEGTSYVLGFALAFSSLPGSNLILAAFRDTANLLQCELRLDSGGFLQITRNNNAVTGGVSNVPLSVSIANFNYVEWKVTIGDSIAANSCQVRVNGSQVLSVAAGQDLKNSTLSGAGIFQLGPYNTGSGPAIYFDDFYLCDQSGPTNNDFLGDVRIDTLLPNADGTYSDFTPNSGTNHFSRVAEGAPDLTTFVSSSTLDHRDSYQMGDLSTVTGTIKGVQVNNAALKDDAGARSIANIIRSGAADEVSSTVALNTSQLFYSSVHPLDPATGLAWTEAGVNAVQVGVKVAV